MKRFLTRFWPWSEIVRLERRLRWYRAEIERLKAGPKRDARGRFKARKS